MKSIVILYESNSEYSNEKSFGNYSAKELCEAVYSKLDIDIIKINKVNNVLGLISSMRKTALENKADYVIFSYDDLPFIDISLVNKMIESHENYKAEYTYADGYPYGFSPEIIDTSALGILQELATTNHKEEGEKADSRDCVYNLLKTEINSFEVEAVIADEDWRLLRLGFHCGKKENFLSSVALFNQLIEKSNKKADVLDKEDIINVISSFTPNEKSKIASNSVKVLKTVPCFYNIQIVDYVSNNPIYSPYVDAYREKYNKNPMEQDSVKDCYMSYENISYLIDKISSFSNTAVISLSLWGEAFAHKDILKIIEKILSYKGLSVFIETDGYSLSEELCEKMAEIVKNAAPRTNGWDKLMIAVVLDSVSSPMYNLVHKESPESSFEKALEGINNLYKTIPEAVYPQFTRMNENEDELEQFFRFWNEKNNKSGGKFIIQKYDNFAGLLKNRKPADLSPIERNICWHLRRDFHILSNGDVPICKTCLFSSIAGNVFNDSLENIWDRLDEKLCDHINKNYNKMCGQCDEYYTFNF